MTLKEALARLKSLGNEMAGAVDLQDHIRRAQAWGRSVLGRWRATHGPTISQLIKQVYG